MNVLIRVQDGVKTTIMENGFLKEETVMNNHTEKHNKMNVDYKENHSTRKAFDCEADGSFAESIASIIEHDWTPIVKPARNTTRKPEYTQEEVFIKIPTSFLDRFAERRIEARRKLERDSYYVSKGVTALDNAIKDFFAYLYGGRDDQKITSAEFAIGLVFDLENILLDSNITIDNRVRQVAKRCVNDAHDTLFNLISALAEGEKILRAGRQPKSLRSPNWGDLLDLL